MIYKLIHSAGGRGFIFAIVAFLFTAGFTIFGGMDWSQWVTYNLSIGLGFMGAKAASKFRKNGSG